MTTITLAEPRASLSRRHLLFSCVAFGLLPARSEAQQVYKEIGDLLPGEFTWHPERSPSGGVAVVVSIPEQLVHVYRNGIRIAVSTCSTGRKGHATPTGVFTVLQKDRDHRSATYGNAPMPNMNRLTWDGIALHAGELPGYPASHGCVRLPLEFSKLLFEITHVGTPVIIAGSHGDPWELIHPGMALVPQSEAKLAEAVTALDARSHPSDWTEDNAFPVVTVIASSGDRRAILFENGEQVATGTVTLRDGARLGEHVFMLEGRAEAKKGLIWVGITHSVDPDHPNESELDVLNRVIVDDDFARSMSSRMHPGMTLILTDIPLTPDRQSGRDFVVMSS
jgi:hypothetical protein